jgi:hypothetical protein
LTLSIQFLLQIMYGTIYLHNETFCSTEKIYNKASDWLLPPKLTPF